MGVSRIIAAAMLAMVASSNVAAQAIPSFNDIQLGRDELRAYAAALIQISKIIRARDSALAAAPATARSAILHDTNALVAQVLAQHKLTQKRFNWISQQADQRRAVRRQLQQYVMEDRLGI